MSPRKKWTDIGKRKDLIASSIHKKQGIDQDEQEYQVDNSNSRFIAGAIAARIRPRTGTEKN
jgi:hypothetical protein